MAITLALRSTPLCHSASDEDINYINRRNGLVMKRILPAILNRGSNVENDSRKREGATKGELATP